MSEPAVQLDDDHSHDEVSSEAARPEAEVDPAEHLLDVGAASFPGFNPEAVFHPDDRVRVTTTNDLPWRVNASLRITARDGSRWIGTGWFISPRTLVTAGHCVFIKGSGVPGRDGWVRSIDVMPGRNEAFLPFGTVTATSFRTVRAWAEQKNESFDYGAIILPVPLGNTTGLRRFAVRNDAALVNTQAEVAGYPGDKPPGTAWRHALPIRSVNPLKVFYTIDTAGGQSGAAVCVTEDGEPVAVGVHAYGGGTSNSATRITQDVFNNLQRWSA
jgi:glutamyl endopeptidase